METIVILNNIRSSENVGSIFRTADAAGVSKIILCGYTPAPIDRFGRKNKGLIKASLGAEEFVKWERTKNLKEAISSLQNSLSENFSDFMVIAVEQDKKSIDHRVIKKNIGKKSRIALVFGNEVDGLSKSDLKLCDLVAEISMRGKKESLNVAVCAGIILFSI